MGIMLRKKMSELYTKKVAGKMLPLKGETVYCVNPGYVNLNGEIGFKISSLTGGVLSNPGQFWTASSLWRPTEKAKYEQIFPQMVEDGKIKAVGKISADLTIEFSDEGKDWLNEIAEKYKWS